MKYLSSADNFPYRAMLPELTGAAMAGSCGEAGVAEWRVRKWGGELAALSDGVGANRRLRNTARMWMNVMVDGSVDGTLVDGCTGE